MTERMEPRRELAVCISTLSRLQRTRFDLRARSLGITLAQWRAIFAVSCNEGSTQRVIADRIDVGDVTAGRLIDKLVESGWAERRPDPADRRVNRLYLTDRAKPMLEQLSALASEESAIACAGIAEDELSLAVSVLERMMANIDRASDVAQQL